MDLASFTDQTVVNRKTAIGGGLAALAALALPGQRPSTSEELSRTIRSWSFEGALPARDSRAEPRPLDGRPE